MGALSARSGRWRSGWGREEIPGRVQRGGRSAGFTLIELLVVIVILGIALAMVTVNGMPSAARGLSFEAERLAQLLQLARDEAQVRGRAIRLQADASGYRFQVLSGMQWRPLIDDADLRARAWDAPTEVRLARADGRAEVVFGRESVDLPFELTLQRADAVVAIRADGLGRFDVR